MTALADETARGSVEHNHLFALRGHLALLDRLRALRRKPLAAFLRHVIANVPHYAGLKPRTTLRGLPVVTRAMMRADRARFLSRGFEDDTARFLARTNGTLSPSLPVSFDTAAFYDFNYFSLYRIVTARPGLAEALERDRVGIVLISDDPDQPRYTVRMPLLGDCLRGPTLVDLPGRDAAWFDVPRAGRVTSAQLGAVLDRPELVQFEVRQDAGGALAIRWIADDGVAVRAVARQLADGIGALVGDAAVVTRTDSITVFGGKQRRFVRAQPPPSA